MYAPRTPTEPHTHIPSVTHVPSSKCPLLHSVNAAVADYCTCTHTLDIFSHPSICSHGPTGTHVSSRQLPHRCPQQTQSQIPFHDLHVHTCPPGSTHVLAHTHTETHTCVSPTQRNTRNAPTITQTIIHPMPITHPHAYVLPHENAHGTGACFWVPFPLSCRLKMNSPISPGSFIKSLWVLKSVPASLDLKGLGVLTLKVTRARLRGCTQW